MHGVHGVAGSNPVAPTILDIIMKCLSCSHSWKRTKIKEYISFLSTCPRCGSRLLLRNDALKAILNLLNKGTSRK